MTSPNWRNTLSFLFARYLAALSVATRPLALLAQLVGDRAAESPGLQLVLADCFEILNAKGYPPDDASQDRLRGLLLASMTARSSAKARSDLGKALGRIGDPRFEERRWLLPKAPHLGFIRIDTGPFLMGSDPRHAEISLPHERPEHQVTLDEFYIGMYPVTVSQFSMFLRVSGYKYPDQLGSRTRPITQSNHISWNDALASLCVAHTAIQRLD